jgi:hypothetical protein
LPNTSEIIPVTSNRDAPITVAVRSIKPLARKGVTLTLAAYPGVKRYGDRGFCERSGRTGAHDDDSISK